MTSVARYGHKWARLSHLPPPTDFCPLPTAVLGRVPVQPVIQLGAVDCLDLIQVVGDGGQSGAALGHNGAGADVGVFDQNVRRLVDARAQLQG